MARPAKEEKALRITEEHVVCEAVLLNNALALYMLPVGPVWQNNWPKHE